VKAPTIRQEDLHRHTRTVAGDRAITTEVEEKSGDKLQQKTCVDGARGQQLKGKHASEQAQWLTAP
jgi:hypothetical protein